MFREQGEPHGHRDRSEIPGVIPERQVAHESENPFRRDNGALATGVGKNHDELLTAEPARDVALPADFLQRAPDRAQDAVAGVMAIRVVEALEVIHVDHEQREAAAAAPAARDLPVQGFFQETPVVQAGQRVADGLLAQVFAQPDVGDRQGDLFRERDCQLPFAGQRRARSERNPQQADQLALHDQRHAKIRLADLGLARCDVRADRVVGEIRHGVHASPTQRPAILGSERRVVLHRIAP